MSEDKPSEPIVPEELDFETALERLEQIVSELESGTLGLEQSLARFEEAMRLRELCARKLREAETRVEEYTAPAEAAAEALPQDAQASNQDAATGGLFEDLG
jgi:exodeoxyribonuclease VII small subunit